MTGIGNLPKNWSTASVGDVCSQPQYGYTTKASDRGDLRLLRTSDITSGRINWETVPYCSANPDDLEKYIVKDGDILVSRAGSVGVSYLVTKPLKAVFASYLIRFKPFVDRQFFAYFLQSPAYWIAIADEKLGIAVFNVNATKLKSITLPIPPAAEQYRIVAKIEELFFELDKGIESLKTARAKLDVYRQAVLKHAFEGKLTDQWRKENKDKLEEPEKLLVRIQQERKARYERQFQKWKAAGGKGSKPRAPKSLPLLTAEELAELPELPEGWCWTRFGLLDIELKRGPFGSSITKSMFVPNGFKVYEQGNAIYCDALRGSYFINDEKYEELSGFAVWPGDFIVSCAGTVGRIFELPENAQAGVINQALMRIRINDTILIKTLFVKLFESAFFQRKVLSDAKGTAMVNLAGIKELNLLPVAICSASEQKAIDELLDARLSEVDQSEQAITTSLEQAEALRWSILKIAFSGQLVPQDPRDESASALLSRIKAEKSKN